MRIMLENAGPGESVAIPNTADRGMNGDISTSVKGLCRPKVFAE